MSACPNVVLIVGIISVASVSCVSLFTGHNHVLECIGVISALASGGPHVARLWPKKDNPVTQ